MPILRSMRVVIWSAKAVQQGKFAPALHLYASRRRSSSLQGTVSIGAKYQIIGFLSRRHQHHQFEAKEQPHLLHYLYSYLTRVIIP